MKIERVIDKNILFNEERVNTCHVDQLDIKTFDNIKTHLETLNMI